MKLLPIAILAGIAFCSLGASAAETSSDYDVPPFEVRAVFGGFVSSINPRGREFDAIVDRDIVRPAFRACNVPANETTPHSVAFVADITPRGTAVAVVARPDTPMGRCMREQFSNAHWPYIGGLNGKGMQPVVTEMDFR